MSTLAHIMLIAGVAALAVGIVSLVPELTQDRPYETDDDEHDDGEAGDDHAKSARNRHSQ